MVYNRITTKTSCKENKPWQNLLSKEMKMAHFNIKWSFTEKKEKVKYLYNKVKL